MVYGHESITQPEKNRRKTSVIYFARYFSEFFRPVFTGINNARTEETVVKFA